MKFEIWSDGDPSVGICGCSASVTIDNAEEWDDDTLKATKETLEDAFKDIFDDTRIHVLISTEIT